MYYLVEWAYNSVVMEMFRACNECYLNFHPSITCFSVIPLFIVILGAVSVVVGFLTMFAWIKRIKRMPRGEKTMLLQKEDTE